ncbi:LmbU family transcriptional regulator [Streptomyces sp. NPDC057375]|uniref:LmbU family transcriptional regulator n=1 Tax=Streptomyces sp. NPDC057375 TaxID=3346109 RepID=UPI0036332061
MITNSVPQTTRTRNVPAVTAAGNRSVGDDPRRDKIMTTRVSLYIPPDLEFVDWEQAGRQLAGIIESSCWWLGDWLVYGKDNYVDRYQRGIRAAGLKYQTLRNYAWVSRRFEVSRRRARLTFQHHLEIASLPFDQQEQWLDRAEELKWTTKQLRSAVRDASAATAGGDGQSASPHRLAVPSSCVPWWRQAAEQSGVEFDRWVLVTLNRAAEQILGAER